MSSTSSLLQTKSSSFKDSHNRTIILRGTNLSGSSKLPTGRASQESYHFYEDGESGDLTYVGRPFLLWIHDLPEEERNAEINEEQNKRRSWYTSNWEDSADCHLARLKGWGFNFLRYLVTWEALEHDGPGKYDHEFVDFTIAILRKCKQYGFQVYIDPHQDVWSRFSGGSGAPYWTLVACGLNPRNFTQTGTAILHHEFIPLNNPESDRRPDPAQLPAMLWSTGYNRLAAQTLFTLFFGGRTYAPKCMIDGLSIQDYLQSHYINAFGYLADRIHDADVQASPEERLFDECIIGWDSMNEPYAGFCAMGALDWDTTSAHGAALQKGPQPSVMQNLCLGMGIKQSNIPNWEFGSFGPRKVGEIEIDPRGVRMWISREDAREDENGVNARWGWKRGNSWLLGTCIWALHGVWSFSDGTTRILNPTYFVPPPTISSSSASGSPFLVNFWLPHFKDYAARIRSAKSHPNSILFIQPPVFEPPPEIDESILQGRACLSTHYYDGLTLVTRHWGWFNADALGVIRGKYKWTWQAVKIGTRAIRASLQEQLSILKADARFISSSQAYPTIIGEIGIPLDMDHKRSYGLPYADPKDGDKYKGDYSEQVKALDASLNALDGNNVLNATVWNYSVGNGHRWGDEWNLEDLSLWSRDDIVDEEAEEIQIEQGVKDEADMMNSQANLLNNDKVLSLTPPITPTAATMSAQAVVLDRNDEESSQILHPPSKGRFLHVDTDSVITPNSAATSPTAASPMSSFGTSTPMHSYSPTSTIPPNPFATSANNTATSLPLARTESHLQEMELRIPLSLLPSSQSETGSIKAMRRLTQVQPTHFKHQQTAYTASYLGFLISGARALEAFARPYPIATVGRPIDLSFDVESGEFKMSVLVPVTSDSPGLEREGDIEEPPTEIFLPLVHYASKEVSKMMTMRQRDFQVACATGHHPPTSPYFSHPHVDIRTGTTAMIDDDDIVPPTPQSMTTQSKPILDSAAASASSMTLANILTKLSPALPTAVNAVTSATLGYHSVQAIDTTLLYHNTPFDFDIDIQVSHGRTTLEGQTLKWYYHLPSEGKEEGLNRDEDGPSVYQICVRRGGGKIESNEEDGDNDDGERTCARMCWEALDRCRKGFIGC